jgi:hypothetical protein
MATQTDFWGEIVSAAERTPVSIMREQAALLGTKTRNLIEARVESSTFQAQKDGSGATKGGTARRRAIH